MAAHWSKRSARVIAAWLDINIRESTVLGFVGAGGIGLQLNAAMMALAWSEVTTILLAILATVVFSEFGRRLHPNCSDGTDHGTAGQALNLVQPGNCTEACALPHVGLERGERSGRPHGGSPRLR